MGSALVSDGVFDQAVGFIFLSLRGLGAGCALFLPLFSVWPPDALTN